MKTWGTLRWLPDHVLSHLRAVAQPEPGEPRLAAWSKQDAPHAEARVARTALSSGERVGDRFVIQAPIGSGGMGVVYRAVDTLTGDLAAVKVLRVADATLAARLEREAAVLEQLAHPGIVRPI